MNINVTFSESNQELYTEFEEQGGSFGVGFDNLKTIHGKDGASAYEIALEHGFEGSEEEWLDSLHGKDGVDGLDGKDGYTPVKGVDYFDGKDGATGPAGADGYTPVKGVDYFDGKDGAAGKDGYTPQKGVDYFDGEDGISPTVEVSKSGKVTTITITDANGTKTATINDGEDGEDGEGGGGAVSSVNGMVGDVVIESDVFYAVYGTTTTAELEAALTAGKAVYCKNGAYIARFLRKNGTATRHVFGYRDTEYLCDSDKWSSSVVKFSPATHAETHAADGSDPITPAAIGAVSKNGDTMTDRLRIANDGGLQLEYDDSGSGVFIHGSYNDGEPWVELLGSEGDEPVQLSGIADPVDTHDAANKQYVDNAVANAGGGGNISFAEEAPNAADMEDGELRIVKEADGEVYEILEYIESTAGGNQYFDTGFYPDQDTKVVMDVQQTGENTADTNQGFFGARNASAKMFAAAWHRTNAAYYVFFNSANKNVASAQIKTRMTVTMDKNVLTVGNSITVSGTYAAFQSDYPLYLFAMNVTGAADYFGVERVFSTQIYNGSGELVRNYEPRRRVSDGLVGLYDKVNNTFGGSGAGTFTAGPVVRTQTDAEAYFKKDDILYMLSDPVARMLANGGAKIAIGSYIGTGTVGSSAPNSFTFEITPKVVIIISTASVGPTPLIYYWGDSNAFAVCRNSSTLGYANLSISTNGNTMTWHHTPGVNQAAFQYNANGTTYRVIGII